MTCAAYGSIIRSNHDPITLDQWLASVNPKWGWKCLEPVDCGDGWIAWMVFSNGARTGIWIVTFNGEPIGYLVKDKFSPGGWYASILVDGVERPLHRFVTKDTRRMVDEKLRSLRFKLMKR